MLYIVPTPIGNLKDITLRALEVLKSVDMIACEDTRHTRILLQEYGISTPTTSYFQHNRITKGEYLIALLKEGKDVALVSDAGTPGIMDPGYHLINAAIKESIAVSCLPGPAALITALAVSGKPAHEYFFAGFLPNKHISRLNRLKELAAMGCTVVCYESCHRISSALEDIGEAYGEKEIVVCRELSKKFEEVLRGKAADIKNTLTGKKLRGEFVVVL